MAARWARHAFRQRLPQFLAEGAERLGHVRPVVMLKAGAACLLVTHFGASIVVCAGPSMLPSVLSGDILFVNKAALRIWKSDLQIGDVVVCSSPDSGGKVVAKRVCGVENQVVHVSAWKSPTGRDMQRTVPQGHVWIEGDNWELSHDSRHHGAIPLALVRGRADFRLWPPTRFGRVPPRPAGTDPISRPGAQS